MVVALVASAALACGGGKNDQSTPTNDASAEAGDASTDAPTDAPTDARTTAGWHLRPLLARFQSAQFATDYLVSIEGDIVGSVAHSLPPNFTVSWRLELKLVDPSGAADPTDPGTGAAVDVGCSNAGVGTPDPLVVPVTIGGSDRYLHTEFFTWTHPDPPNSTPPGKYGCDHTLQGPHGHQGLITVVVSDGIFQCTQTYKGTHDSDANSEKNGTATPAECKRI